MCVRVCVSECCLFLCEWCCVCVCVYVAVHCLSMCMLCVCGLLPHLEFTTPPRVHYPMDIHPPPPKKNPVYYTNCSNFFRMRISSQFVDFSLTMCQFSRAHHEEVVNMSWVDWCGKMLKDSKVFLSVLGLNSQPWGC